MRTRIVPRTEAHVVARDGAAAARAGAASVLSRLVVAVLGWIGTVVVVRALSPAEWGQFSFVFGLLGLLVVFTDLGVGRVVLHRLIDDDPHTVRATATSFVMLRALLGVVGYLLALGYVIALDSQREVVLATATAGLVVVFATPSHALSVLYQSRHRMGYVAAVDVAGQIVQVASIVAAALFAPILLVLVLPAVLKEIVVLAAKYRGATSDNGLGLRFPRTVDLALWLTFLREALPMSIGYGLIFAMVKSDLLVVEACGTFEDVGEYSVAYKFADVLDLVTVAAMTPLTTLLVAAWPAAPREFAARSRQGVVALSTICACAAAAFVPVADSVLSLLYGSEYRVAADAARLLVLASTGTALVLVGIAVLAAAGRHRDYPWIAAVGLTLNIGADIVVVPSWGYDGAALVSVGSSALTAALVWAVVAGSSGVRSSFPLRAVATLAGITVAVVGLGTVLVRYVWWPAVPVISVALLVAAAVLTGVLRELTTLVREARS